MDTGELGLFLACSMSQQEIDSEGLGDVVHSRRFKAGARPGLTCKAIIGGPALSPCKSYRSLQAVFNRGGYLAVQFSWVLFMSESENNQTNILIK